jgi:GT2 family glycosyltransferase
MRDPAPGFPADVEIAIVSHNGLPALERVFACLEDAGAPPSRMTLYDIASTDGTATWMARRDPAVRVVPLAQNAGPNPARNLAVTRAGLPYVLVLDSDAYLRPDTILRLREAAPGAGMVVPVVVHATDPDRIQYAGGALHFLCEATSRWQDRAVADRGLNRELVGSAPGLCCLIDVAAARHAGLFDERYFMGKEDGEFCYRLRVAGYTIVEEPAARVEHASRPRSTWLYRFQIRNRWDFMLKNYEARTLLLLAPALAVHEPLQLLLLAARGELGAWIRAAGDLVRSLPGLGARRRAVAAVRRVHDAALLSADPLVVRADVIGRTSRLKGMYDAALSMYWRAVSRLLPR